MASSKPFPPCFEGSAMANPTQNEPPVLYDVFVSYRQRTPDKEWVQKTLVPRLEAAGVRVFVDYKHFRLGATLIPEMERGVEQSRYTLAVLTPAYLESNYTELENVLADHLGIEKGERRLLMILREPCQARLRMRARLWLDMTKDEEFDEALSHLVYELTQPSTY
jgi:TIR domain